MHSLWRFAAHLAAPGDGLRMLWGDQREYVVFSHFLDHPSFNPWLTPHDHVILQQRSFFFFSCLLTNISSQTSSSTMWPSHPLINSPLSCATREAPSKQTRNWRLQTPGPRLTSSAANARPRRSGTHHSSCEVQTRAPLCSTIALHVLLGKCN